MTHPITTTLGLSAGSGMIHCALVTVDDHQRLVVDSRVIDVDHTDRLDGPGRVNSGIDLMLDRAAETGLSVTAIGVAARGGAITSRGSGRRRQVHVVDDPEAIGLALAHTGAVAAHPRVVVVDSGDSGTSVFTLRTDDGVISTVERTTELSGAGIDEVLAGRAAGSMTDLGRRRRAELLSACRTAKEELGAAQSATVTVAGHDFSITAAMLDEIVAGGAAVVGEAVERVRRRDATDPGPVVLVGGLAAMPAVRTAIERSTGDAPLVPETPELLSAIGAALAARPGSQARSTLGFIGGRRPRDLLSVVPVAVVGAVVVAAMLTAVVIGVGVHGTSASTGADPSTTVPSSVSQVRGDPVASTVRATPTTTATPSVAPTGAPDADRSEAPTTTTATGGYEYAPDLDGEGRATRPWATTQLPTTQQGGDVPTSTITAPPPSSTAPYDSPITDAPSLTPYPLTPYPFTPVPGPTTAPRSIAPGAVAP
ncbi:Hsp70 family protein [Williamsia deligens]|uniref:Hsp70 family protein n=1 Tax=Williamsia deligens TaxID=321325 RepID=A0ABW3G9P3_9NOCA|nr:Hsp70 family protein [Williamsia deligens]MCP2192347.1 Hsp70 protein [Williamsia deligens]